MKNDKNAEELKLRQIAEEELTNKPFLSETPHLPLDVQQLIHELQVHHVELEMQNQELTRAKEESEISRIRFVDLYDFAPSGYFTLTAEGDIIQLNLCASQMIGKERNMLINSRLGFFISEDTRSYFNNFLHNIFKYKNKENCEVTFISQDEDPIFVQLNGALSENREYCLVSAVNITERKRAEIALNESRKLYSDLVCNQSAGIYRIRVEGDEDGKSVFERSSLEFASERFCELFGIEDSGNLDRIFSEWFLKIHPDYQELFVESYNISQKLFKTCHCKIQLAAGNGIKWIEIESNPRVMEDMSTVWTGIVLDITEQKLAEEVIRESEEKYRMLLELASDAFFHGNEHGDFIMVNSHAVELTGFSKDELLKMNMADLFSEDCLKNMPLKYELLRKGEAVVTEREVVCKDGRKIIVDMNSKMMPDGTFQSFFRDITERKRIENTLKQKLHEMEIYYELAVTRERKMITLKSEINMLLRRLGEEPKY